MKTVKFKLISALLLLIIAFSLTNCIISKDDKKEYDQLKARCELESQNKSTVRQVFEAINARDFEKMRTFYAPEYKMTGPRLPNAYTIDSLIQYIQRDIDIVMNGIEEEFDYPVFVKPANMGSSVGISKAHDRGELVAAIKEAFVYDNKLILEAFVKGREIE